MPKIEMDRKYLEEAVLILDEYIISPEISWPLTSRGREHLPPLTPGNLILCQARLSCLVEAVNPRQETARLLASVERHIDRWNANWQMKAKKEYPERLRLWRNYLDEFSSDPTGNRGSYPYQVRLRVILQLLEDEFGVGSQNTAPSLHLADQALLSHTRPGSFVWEEGIRSGFPADKFWFLYLMI
jgi:hypothetical protein